MTPRFLPSLVVVLFLFAGLPQMTAQFHFQSRDVNFSYHRIEKGQTLYSISRQYRVSVSELKVFNRLSTNTIFAGGVLRIPGGQKTIDIPEAPAVQPVRNKAMPIYSGTLRTLHVGVTDYVDPSLKDLVFTRNDADGLSEVFEKQKGKTFGQKIDFEVHDRNSTRGIILFGLSRLSRLSQPNDLMVVHFSGHARKGENGKLLLLPRDFNPETGRNAITIADLMWATQRAKSPILFFLDVCYAGQAGQDLVESLQLANSTNQYPDVGLMVAARGDEISMESDKWKNGAFSKALIEGATHLADYDKNGEVEISELSLYVTQRVEELTEGRQHAWMPINLIGDMTVFRLDE